MIVLSEESLKSACMQRVLRIEEVAHMGETCKDFIVWYPIFSAYPYGPSFREGIESKILLILVWTKIKFGYRSSRYCRYVEVVAAVVTSTSRQRKNEKNPYFDGSDM